MADFDGRPEDDGGSESVQMTPEEEKNEKNKADYFESYDKFARLLRTWLITYAAGLMLFLASNDTIGAKIAASGDGPEIVKLIITAIALQVFSAVIYKYSMLAYYFRYDEEVQLSPENWKMKLAQWISRHAVLEIGIDIGSIYCLGVATRLALTAAL